MKNRLNMPKISGNGLGENVGDMILNYTQPIILTHLVPELRVYKIWDKPIGPHPIAMFEVNLFTPAQFGAFIPWLNVWRGPLSALVHPNTIPEEGVNKWASMKRDHLERAIWMGERIPLDLSLFNRTS